MNFNTRSLKWIAGQSERHNVVSCQNRYKYVKESTSSSSRVSGSSLKWNKQTSLSVRPRSEFSNSGSNSLVPTRKNYPHIFSKVHRDGSCDRIHLCISNNSMTAASKRNNLYKYVRKDSSAIQSEVKESVNKPNSESPNTRAKSTSLHMAGSLSAKMHARNVDRFRYIKPGSSLLNPKLETLGGNSVNSKFLVKKMDQQSSSYSSRFHYKFLLRICPLGKDACPLAHVLDPCRLPQCSFYESGNCDRDQCPYLHVNYPPDTAVCSDFTMGRCSRGRLVSSFLSLLGSYNIYAFHKIKNPQ
ncbi:unnamed protein product [Trichobilharzia regenti]|nr:unnamed protein product [Trichobilharzia regenti]